MPLENMLDFRTRTAISPVVQELGVPTSNSRISRFYFFPDVFAMSTAASRRSFSKVRVATVAVHVDF